MKKEIIYPGNDKQPCVAKYEIQHEAVNNINHAKVIIHELYEENPGGTILGHPEICEYLVNKILIRDLHGVRLDFIEFYYAWKNNGEDVVSEIRYQLDSKTFIQNGGKYNSTYFSIFRQFKAWLVSLLGGIIVPDRIDFLSYDVTAAIGEVRVTEDPLQCVINQGE